jgi:hypothetical protein
MNLPPLAAHVGYRCWGLWLPLFLLWPLILLAVPLYLLGAVVLDLSGLFAFRELTRFGAGLYALLCGVRGTRVRVETPQARIVVDVY